MNNHGTTIKLAIFLVVTTLTAVFLGSVLNQSQPIAHPRKYKAVFTNASYLTAGSDVRIAGVTVGKVDAVRLQQDGTALVSFHMEDNPALPSDARAAIQYKNLIGGRFIDITRAAGRATTTLPAGAVIPLQRTTPALDINTLVGGFKPLFKALAPEQINELSAEVIEVFQGQAGSVAALLSSIASMTSSLADHNTMIEDLITNLDTALGTIDQHDAHLSNLITQLQTLVSGLAAKRDPIGDAIVHINDLADSASTLLAQIRPDLASTINQLGTISSTINANSTVVNTTLKNLPAAYDLISSIGVYGDFFNVYVCDLRVKATGPNGDPVFTPWVDSQVSRCSSKPAGH